MNFIKVTAISYYIVDRPQQTENNKKKLVYKVKKWYSHNIMEGNICINTNNSTVLPSHIVTKGNKKRTKQSNKRDNVII